MRELLVDLLEKQVRTPATKDLQGDLTDHVGV